MQHFASCSSLIFLILLSAGVDAEEAITMQWLPYQDSECKCKNPKCSEGDEQPFRGIRFLSTSSMCVEPAGPGGPWKLSTTCQDGKVVGTIHSCDDMDCSNCTTKADDHRLWFTSENMDKRLAGECHTLNSTQNPLGHVEDPRDGDVYYMKVNVKGAVAYKMENVCKDTSIIPTSACKKTTTSNGVGFIFSSVLVLRTLLSSLPSHV